MDISPAVGGGLYVVCRARELGDSVGGAPHGGRGDVALGAEARFAAGLTVLGEDPVADTLDMVRRGLIALAGADLGRLSDDGLLVVAQLTETINHQVFAGQIAQTAEIDQRRIAHTRRCSSTGALLRQVCLLSHAEAYGRVRTSKGVAEVIQPSGAVTPPTLPLLSDAIRCGVVGAESAKVITGMFHTLPAEVDPDLLVLAEEVIVDQAAATDPTELRKVAQQIQIRLDPDGKLPHERRQRMSLEFGNRNHYGLTSIRGYLDDPTVEALRQAIEPLAAPMPAVDGIPDSRSAANRRACALGELATLFLNQGLGPSHAGSRPNVTVLMSLTQYTGRDHTPGGNGCGAPDDGVTVFDNPTGWRGPPRTTYGGSIHPATARRIACDAKITPIVLGGNGEILDVGRSRYTFPVAIRKALEARDLGCTWPGCDRPPGWTQAHHVVPWSQGGETSLTNAVLLCHYHHTAIHETDWTIHLADDGHRRIPCPTVA